MSNLPAIERLPPMFSSVYNPADDEGVVKLFSYPYLLCSVVCSPWCFSCSEIARLIDFRPFVVQSEFRWPNVSA